jgi:hypothetical protein
MRTGVKVLECWQFTSTGCCTLSHIACPQASQASQEHGMLMPVAGCAPACACTASGCS